MEENLYKVMYPTGRNSPKFYGLPKIHETGTPQAYCIKQGFSHLWSGESPC